MTAPHSFTCPHCARRYRLVRRFADPPAPAAAPSPKPAESGEVALAGADGRQAARLLRAAKEQGAARLTQLARGAVKRLLRDGGRGDRLFTDGERADLADTLAATLATGELLGRARIRIRVQRLRSGARMFADAPTPFKGTFAPAPIEPLPPNRALDFFRSLTPTIGVDGARAFDAEKRRVAFTLAVDADDVVLQKVKGVIAQALESGTGTPGDIDAILDAAGIGPNNPSYSRMVMTTNLMSSYVQGSEDEVRQPDVIDAFAAWQWLAVPRAGSRPHHAARSGLYYPMGVTFADVRTTDIGEVANCLCTPTYVPVEEWGQLQAGGARLAA